MIDVEGAADGALIDRLLALVEGMECHYTCACRRILKVSNSTEINKIARELRRRQTDEPSLPETTRFGLIEVD